MRENMPRTKGTKQLNAEVSDTLLDQFKAFCESRGETLRASLEMAMRRHMANPPPPPPPPIPAPLPPIVPLPPVANAADRRWAFSDKRVYFDGNPTQIKTSRQKLLRVLVEADGPYSSKELSKLAFDGKTDEENTRYHIRELRKELQEALGIEGNPIPGDSEGYRLDLDAKPEAGKK
jgi:DNA-binding response OmpR family regulator